MKKKSILLAVSFCAIVTLSFSFVGNSEQPRETEVYPSTSHSDAPVGGFVLEDELEK